MKAIIEFVSTFATVIRDPVVFAMAVLVPCTLSLAYWWLVAPSSVFAWPMFAIGVLLLVLILFIVGLALRATIFAPDWVERYPSGQVRARGPHYHGDRQGHWTFWHEDGGKECEGQYAQGSESGTWTFYHRNGRSCARGQLEGWRRHGAWEFWDEAGCPLDEAGFLAGYAPADAGRFPNRADATVVAESASTEPKDEPDHPTNR